MNKIFSILISSKSFLDEKNFGISQSCSKNDMLEYERLTTTLGTRFFRVIPIDEYLKEFASDRRHMLNEDGTWIKPPPIYPAIRTPDQIHNLDDFIDMNPDRGPGQVFNCSDFRETYS